MEKKYNPDNILMGTHGRYFMRPKYKDSEVHDYKVFIEVNKSNNECYQICAQDNKRIILSRGICYGKSWTEKKSEYLFNDRNLLGKVHVVFKGKIIETYPNYDDFWNKIKR